MLGSSCANACRMDKQQPRPLSWTKTWAGMGVCVFSYGKQTQLCCCRRHYHSRHQSARTDPRSLRCPRQSFRCKLNAAVYPTLAGRPNCSAALRGGTSAYCKDRAHRSGDERMTSESNSYFTLRNSCRTLHSAGCLWVPSTMGSGMRQLPCRTCAESSCLARSPRLSPLHWQRCRRMDDVNLCKTVSTAQSHPLEKKGK